jgi:hypothetical protein
MTPETTLGLEIEIEIEVEIEIETTLGPDRRRLAPPASAAVPVGTASTNGPRNVFG